MLLYLPRSNNQSSVQTTYITLCDLYISAWPWFGRYQCPDPPRANDALGGVITWSLKSPFQSPQRTTVQSLTAQQISNFTQANRGCLLNGKAWGQDMHLQSLARGCLQVATVVSPVAVPHRGGVTALPSHSVKSLKTFLDISAFDHYQYLPAASRRAPQLAGSAPISRAACHTHISG